MFGRLLLAYLVLTTVLTLNAIWPVGLSLFDTLIALLCWTLLGNDHPSWSPMTFLYDRRQMEYHSQHYPSPIPGYYGNHTYQESQRQQEQGQQIYMSKASNGHVTGSANPFGAVGSETASHLNSRQAVEQAHGASAAYDYEAYYPSVQETQQFEKHQQQQQHLQAPEEPAPIVTSGVGLSGWLAEAVWELCTVPFAPTVRAGDAIEEE